ncbi:MAG TPA: single-stranded DNA-binding protein [Bacteroidales bacterium]|nr:single-stranded DNA-binding protein [Bacteroidales bacterium]HPS16462.1 single-stranded DNA-binding protein [Bacteroidales bacterium]
MAGINKVILIGNLGKNAEIRSFENNTKISFSLATTEVYKGRDGQNTEQTEWHEVVFWRNGMTEFAERNLKKGTKVYIEGKIRTRSWDDKDGVKKYRTEIIGDKVEILVSKRDDNTSSNEHIQEEPYSATTPAPEPSDDLPF